MVVPEHFAAGVINHLRLQLEDVDLRGLFKHPLYSDVVLRYKDQEFLLHKLILSARSPFFARLLLTAKGQECRGLRLEGSFGIRTVAQVLRYIYGLKIPHWYDMEHLRDIYNVASFFELETLAEFCTKNILYRDGIRFIKLAIIAEENNSEYMKSSLRELFETHWPSITVLNSWQEFASRYPDFASDLMSAISEKE
ncbi:hypothetical protein AVEN_52729-1 [Araneus ventricosus]|uniref:BTB domain-containing protein n=1 Tax=Araneus ventricosus TaxID=182803 RepID=A0A4Y2IJB6_ARAVE|nr:hypothetical protein AVEN_52729-1 [Araneus ventricosus]